MNRENVSAKVGKLQGGREIVGRSDGKVLVLQSSKVSCRSWGSDCEMPAGSGQWDQDKRGIGNEGSQLSEDWRPLAASSRQVEPGPTLKLKPSDESIGSV